MLREVDMSEISDGRLYDENDLVKADTLGCKECHKCCSQMGDSIVIDPLDMKNMMQATGLDFNGLLEKGYIELGVKDYLILPNIRMNGKDECSFLDEEHRCSIHDKRPSICRLFPLGRIYENGDFKYFLQTKECTCDSRVKVKVKQWIGVDDTKRNHEYILEYHDFLARTRDKIMANADDSYTKNVSILILQTLFVMPYVGEDFYDEIKSRLYQLEKKW